MLGFLKPKGNQDFFPFHKGREPISEINITVVMAVAID